MRGSKITKPAKKHEKKELRKIVLSRHPKKHAPTIFRGVGARQRGPKNDLEVGKLRVPAIKSSNEQQLRANSIVTGLAVIDPFEAYERQVHPSLPFAALTVPSTGFWTRNVITISDVLVSTGAATGAYTMLIVAPSPQVLVTQASAFTTGAAAPSGTWTTYGDTSSAAFVTNFHSMTVACQGMRVRNLTAALGLAGEHFVFPGSYGDNASAYALSRSNKLSSVAQNEKGSVASLSYIGNPRAAGIESSVCDYSFCSPGTSIMADELQCMYFRSFSDVAHPQLWEIEIVTYYMAQPYTGTNQLFDLRANPVEINIVTDTMQAAYNKVPRLSATATDMDEYKADTVWGKFTGAIKNAGSLGITALSTLALNSWESLWKKDKADAYLRMLKMIPPEAYPGFAKFLDESDTHAKAVAAAECGLAQSASSKRINQLLSGINLRELSAAIAEDEKADDWPATFLDGGRIRVPPPNSPTPSRAASAATSRRF